MLSSSGHRILVVDDVPDNLFLLQAILESEGYEVDFADNGRSALAKVQASPPDLILLDIMMPNMNGIEVTEKIRQDPRLPFIPILLITAHEEASMIEGFTSGANDFTRKPINPRELLAKVKVFLQLKHEYPCCMGTNLG